MLMELNLLIQRSKQY